VTFTFRILKQAFSYQPSAVSLRATRLNAH